MCIIRLGDVVEGIITVLTLGHGKQLASWISLKLTGNPDCGCDKRRILLNSIVGCKDGIKLKI